MPQSLAKIIIHIIFSTKNHAPFLSNDISGEIFAYIAGILNKFDCYPILVNGVEDHVHILCNLSKNHAVCKIVEEVKKNSSKWIKNKSDEFKSFEWQNGYGVFSVSQSNLEAVKAYISNQRKHHQKLSFKDELRNFLNKYNIKYNEEYLWD